MRTSPALTMKDAEMPSGTGDWLKAVLELARAARQEEPLNSLFTLVAGTAASLTGAAACAVQVASDDRSMLQIQGHVGLSESYLEQVNDRHLISLDPMSPYFHSPSSEAYRSGSIVIVDEVDLDNDYSPWVAVASMALRDGNAYSSMAAVPMVAEGETTGVLAVYSRQAYVATPELLALLQLLAEHAALALTLARVRARERASFSKLVEANNSLKRQQVVIDQADDLHQGLMRAVLRNGDLSSIVATTAHVMGLNVLLEDAHGNELASSGRGRGPCDTWEWRTSELAVRARAVALEESGVSYARLSEDDSAPDAWIAPLVLADEVVAWLWAFGTDIDPDDLQRRLVERAAMAITVELWREQSAREVEWRLSGDLLEHLLREGATNPVDVAARAANLGFDFTAPHTMLVFAFSTGANDVNDGEAVRRSVLSGLEYVLRSLDIKAIRAWHNGVGVVLLSSVYAVDPAEAQHCALKIGRELKQHVPQRDMIVVTSKMCSDLAEFADAYRAARGVVALARPGRDPESLGLRVISAAEMGVYSVLLGATRTKELDHLRDSTLGTLKQYDERKGGKLIETLREYLAQGCKTQPTAAALFMHPNTVMYRLRAIERLTELDLHRPEHVLQVQLALMIEDITVAQ